jgi:hypothetical protein
MSFKMLEDVFRGDSFEVQDFYIFLYISSVYDNISGINCNRIFIFFSNLPLTQVFTTVCHLYLHYIT